MRKEVVEGRSTPGRGSSEDEGAWSVWNLSVAKGRSG
jgi:hypothetical protein